MAPSLPTRCFGNGFEAVIDFWNLALLEGAIFSKALIFQ
jgi:hypothetical protein